MLYPNLAEINRVALSDSTFDTPKLVYILASILVFLQKHPVTLVPTLHRVLDRAFTSVFTLCFTLLLCKTEEFVELFSFTWSK